MKRDGMTLEQLQRVRDQVTAFVMPDQAQIVEGGSLEVVDQGGDTIARLSPVIVRILHGLGKLDRESLIRDQVTKQKEARLEGYKRGRRGGRAELVDTVHELLGVDRIVCVLESMRPV